MNREAEELRKVEKALHEAAEAAGKAAAVMEKESCTPEEMEEATKDLMWKMMILSSLCK